MYLSTVYLQKRYRNCGTRNEYRWLRSRSVLTGGFEGRNIFFFSQIKDIYIYIDTEYRVTGGGNGKVAILYEILNREYGITFFHRGGFYLREKWL